MFGVHIFFKNLYCNVLTYHNVSTYYNVLTVLTYYNGDITKVDKGELNVPTRHRDI